MKNTEKNIINICKASLNASQSLAETKNSDRNKALKLIAKKILKNKNYILLQNKKDIEKAKKAKIPAHLLDRLLLDEKRILNLCRDISNIAKLKDPLGKVINKTVRPNGLKISKITVPIGLIAVIFESRPNVASDVAALCIKSGNSVILKGGKEAQFTTESIIKIIKDALKETNIDHKAVTSLNDYTRKSVNILLKMDKYIDVLVPRGGRALIENIKKNSNIPVFSHLDGICHTYIDKYAKKSMAIDVSFNAKMRRTSICGATETILCHKSVAKNILPKLIEKLINKNCKVKAEKVIKKINKKVLPVKKEDWSTEYLDAVVSIKIVNSLKEAIKHINYYSSGHTDAIITENSTAAKIFFQSINSAIVMHNTSTQFADGAEFGLGAEIGISTGKLHARGPVSAAELTTYKYIVQGIGQLRN
ncbi:MAG: Gamma-glutamyl phosphate reductase [Alphaproteobacteria bacterium MarineAlpha9_Bin4]|nr:MAG: Gamma-glutamyl phosphate reductase [Alphaproteobacteria bacterium MarineAlpha9_Bin4]|tara:strand:- start:2240 stop:3499 length:1260 start_codon:yes stop_codon:yes gene_type:complete